MIGFVVYSYVYKLNVMYSIGRTEIENININLGNDVIPSIVAKEGVR